MERTVNTGSLVRLIRRAGERGMWKWLWGGAAGFFLAAAPLSHRAMPLALGLLGLGGRSWSIAAAVGASGGYWLFWRESQGAVWMGLGLLAVLLAGNSAVAAQQRLLMPALASLVVSASGVWFLLWRLDDTPVGIYLMRVLSGAVSVAVFRRWKEEPSSAAGWLGRGILSLGLSGVNLGASWNLGWLAAGFFAVRCSLPAAALAGLGADLAGVSPVTATGTVCLSFCLRLLPAWAEPYLWAAPGAVYLMLSVLMGIFDLRPLPVLLLGGALGTYIPGDRLSSGVLRRKGVTGLAQVRLEKAAAAMELLHRTLLEGLEPPLDRSGILCQCCAEACDTCPERGRCKTRKLLPELPVQILEQPGLQASDLPPGCKKTTRLLSGLRHGQEQLRRIKGDRSAQRSYRSALLDQLVFSQTYLQRLSDGLAEPDRERQPRYVLDLGVCGRSRKSASGDLCIRFSGVGCKEYVLLCDGMGTGEGARLESQGAAGLLSAYLQAGFTPGQALRSFNSLCVLAGSGGCATADLLEVDLHSGGGVLYKWGAWPSYLLRAGQLKKVGTAGPPPGLSQQARESADRLSLGGGEVLIMLSDGAGEEGLWQPVEMDSGVSAGELAEQILERGAQRFDDATVAVVRLSGCSYTVPHSDSECCRNTRC